MKAQELRIGNYYLQDCLGGDISQITAEDILELYDYPLEDYFKPIPLTEEWLLKFGFEKNIDFEKINDYVKLSESNGRRGVGVYFVDFEWFVTFQEDVGCGWYDLNEIQYVHQLQNLYFALTGDELTIKQHETEKV